MEHEGIFYFFEHAEDKHTLVLTDTPDSHVALPHLAEARFAPEAGFGEMEDTISDWQFTKAFCPGKYLYRDFQFQMPDKNLELSTPTNFSVGGNDKYEIYDFPGEYAQQFNKPDERMGDVEKEGEKLIKIRMQEKETPHQVTNGSSCCRAFMTGYYFDRLLAGGQTDSEGPFVLTSIQHSAVQSPDYYSDMDSSTAYHNSFTCIPHKVPFRPSRMTPKPVVQGLQSAVVVGPSGEEIYCDKYGRVKVQFHWDREGQKDGKITCWVRVSQTMAGPNWGAILLPRILMWY